MYKLELGTSSVVYPAAHIPEYAKRRGCNLIEVNPDDSTPLSSIVDLYVQGTAAEVLPEILENLKRCE